MPAEPVWTDPYGTPVRQFGTGERRIDDYAFALGAARTIWQQRRRRDVVYFLMTGIQLAIAVPAAGLLGVPVVMKFSGSNEVRTLTKSALGRLELAALRRWARRVMLLNDGMVEEALGAGFDSGRLMWMPNPVNTTEFTPASAAERAALRQEFGLPRDSRVAIYTGRLAPEKEIGHLLDAFANTELPEAQLVLVGDGPLRNELQARARQLQIADRVRFTGRLPMDDVRRWLQASDVFVLVSSLEGLPVSLLEAMATGLPAAVSDIPAMLQLVADGKQGIVTRLHDVGSLTAALKRLLGDPDLCARLGREARADVIRAFSTEHVVEKYETMFAELASGGS
jgi:glycosyltransferase involved in cell wall biosynthesis